MHVDGFTSTLAGGLVTLAGGLFLLVFWCNDRTAKAGLWMAVAQCVTGIAVVMLSLEDMLPEGALHIVPHLMFGTGALLTFIAARVFRKGPISPYPVAAGVVFWPVLQILIGALLREQYAAGLGMAITACIYLATAMEFWRGRDEPLRGRIAIIGLLTMHAGALFLRAAQFVRAPAYTSVPPIDWFGIIHLIGLLYGVGMTLLTMTMLKERNEAKHKATASIDPLTGLANRRGFMQRAQQLFARHIEKTLQPISVLAFDLDRFKTINDTYGHATGDQVLRIFADVLARMVRSTDVAGRIGGEEFVTVLSNTDDKVAMTVAERIRATFQNDARLVSGKPIGATVSIGVAISTNRTDEIMDVIASADAAMYRAKQSGRNRVILANADADADANAGADGYAATNVIRIA